MVCNLPSFSFFEEKVKVILWSIRTFWYKGLAKKTMKNGEFEQKASILKKKVVRMKKLFSKKIYGILRLILSRYDIK